MSLIIPYKFKGGTSAKAQEVNANFNQVKIFCDDIETSVASNSEDVVALQNGKASKNGSNQEKFAVATPATTENYNAVNVQYINNNVMSILKYGVFGLKLTLSGNNTIVVAPGACYDSNYVTPIINTNNISCLFGLGVEPNILYHIYISWYTNNNYMTLEIYDQTTPGAQRSPTTQSNLVYRKLGQVTTVADSGTAGWRFDELTEDY